MRIVKSLVPAVWTALVLSSVFCSAGFAATADRISGPVSAANMVELQGHVSPLASPQFDRGPVEPSRPLHVTMLFLPAAAQQQALDKLLAEQQDRASPNYHKWLTSVEYGERFGLSSGDAQKITEWLTSQGFKVTYVANGRDFVSFDGNAAQVDSVFRTAIHSFNVNGKMHFANTASPMVPGALAGIVGGFRGLHDFFPRPMHKRPEYNVTISGFVYHFLAPGDLAAIYDVNPLYKLTPVNDGTGQKVVIAGQSDVYLADLHDYRTAFGISDISCTVDGSGVIHAGVCSSGNFQVVYPTAGDPGVNPGDLGESDLDIETISAVARGAQIIFVTSANGVDDSTSFAIDANPPLARVISYSYGLCEGLVTGGGAMATEEAKYQKAAGEGISFFAASGDAGAGTCDADLFVPNYPDQLGLSVSYPASSQWVTGVGGTEFNEGSGTYWNASNTIPGDGGSAMGYIPEIAWNDTTLSVSNGNGADATGGGPSGCASGTGAVVITDGGGNQYSFEVCGASGGFPKPTWQNGITPSDSARDVPDIAFSASNANDVYIVCVPQEEILNNGVFTSTCASGITSALTSFAVPSAFGGTSASTPVAAAMTVLLNQFLGTGASGLGSINQQLYTLYKNNPPPNGPFHDVTSGTNARTGGTSDNMVGCVAGTPSITGFPATLKCPGTGKFGYSAGAGYDLVTGLGSIDFDAFFKAWQASETGITLSATAASPSPVAAGGSVTSTITVAPTNGFSGDVNLSCPNPPAGITCTNFATNPVTGASGSSVVTIQTTLDMAAGTSSVTVQGTSGAVSNTTTVGVNVTATTETFSLTSNLSGGTLAVTQGANGTVNLTVASSNGFVTGSGANATTVLPVVYSCSDPASESTCIGPSGGTTATAVSFQLTTMAPSAALHRPFDRGSRIFYAALLPGLLGIVLTFGARRSGRGVRLLGLILVLGFSTMWLGSCGGSSGGGSSNPGTPKGPYTIMINAKTTGANPISNSLTFTLNVQ